MRWYPFLLAISTRRDRKKPDPRKGIESGDINHRVATFERDFPSERVERLFKWLVEPLSPF